MRSLCRPTAVFWLVACVAGCASPPPFQPPDVPESLKPPAGQMPAIEAVASGVQIYACALQADGSAGWVFKAPSASLTSRNGEPIGRHFAGPTWQANDGSSVVGEVRASAKAPGPPAIPWLLLAAKANSGVGAFAAIKSIQRVVTVGGVAPSEPCTARNVDIVARVPYTATYYFYR